jgi:hypothetical protein
MSNMNHTPFKTAKELGIKEWERYELERLIPDLEAEEVHGFHMEHTHRCIAGNIYKRHYEGRNIFYKGWAYVTGRMGYGAYIQSQQNQSLKRLYRMWRFRHTDQKAAALAIRGFLTTGVY